MFFVVDKARMQRTLAIVRDDRSTKLQGLAGPFMRLEARDDFLRLDGLRVSARIPATVYEPGVLFLRLTTLRRLLGTISGQPFLSIQVTEDELLLDRVRLPLDHSDMLLYPYPDQAPAQHPSLRLQSEFLKAGLYAKPEYEQLTLWRFFDRQSSVEGEK